MKDTKPIKLAVESVDFFMRNVRMRLPFRYGKACLTAAPLLHARLAARGEDGRTALGVSADMLPPKWFDKAADKDYRQNISDLILAAKTGVQAYLAVASTARSPFDIWLEAYPLVQDATQLVGLNALTGGFGSSIIERAVIDAAGKLAGCDYGTLVRENILGVEPGAVHEELDGRRIEDFVPSRPAESLLVRHTVGLGDPIFESDIDLSDRLNDGIPQSLDAWIREAGIRYFKVKVGAGIDADRTRLVRIAELLDGALPEYRVTLDGNEQFRQAYEVVDWFTALQDEPRLTRLLASVVFIEQPIERSGALSELGGRGLQDAAELPPVIIDESDDHLDAFKEAVLLGYRGVSVKNCKGVFAGLLNRMLVELFREQGGAYILSGEDLCNQPIVPLQQDLCALGVLGIDHAERNGHHYCGTLDHLSASELADCLDLHAPLYEPFRNSARLRIRDGTIGIGTLQQVGFGLGMDTDFLSMTPLADWEYESLGLDESPAANER